MLRRFIYHPEVNFALRQTLVLCLPVAVGWLFNNLNAGLLFSLVPSCCNIAGLDIPHKRFFKRLLVGGSLFALSSFLIQFALQHQFPLSLFLFILPLLLGITGELSPLHGRLLPGSLVAAVLTLSLVGRMPIWGPPLLYIGGTFWYGIFTWGWFKLSRSQQLRESLSLLYRELASYCEEKYNNINNLADKDYSLQNLLKQQQKVVDLITMCYQQLYMLPTLQNRNERLLLRNFQMAQDIQEHITVSLNHPDEIQRLLAQSQATAIIRWNAQVVSARLRQIADDILYHQWAKRFSMEKPLSALEKLAQHFPDNPVSQFCFYHFSHIARVLQREKPLYQRDLMRDRQKRLPLLPALLSYLSLKSSALRSAARFSVMLMFGGIVGLSLNVPKPYWILMTIIFVSQNSYSATRVRIQHRALGTFAGLLIAALTLNYDVSESLVLLIMLVITFFSNLFSRKYYGWATIGFTVTAVYSLQLLSLNGHQFLVPRLTDTLLGCLIAFAGMLWLWPQWQSALLRENSLSTLNAYQEALQLLLSLTPSDEALESERVNVNQKHNTLFNTLTQAAQEPGFKSDYLQDMHLWVNHSQYIVEHINEITALAREHTMLTPRLAESYLQSIEIAIQQCQQRILYGDNQENTQVMEQAENYQKGPATILERHLTRILVHLRTMRNISAIAWPEGPEHGSWLNKRRN